MNRTARIFIPAILLVAITAAVMAPVCRNQFVLLDDGDDVACNAQLAPMTWQSLRFWWSGPVMRIYTPMAYTVWGMTSLVARVPTDPATGISQNPLPFHVVSLLFHLLATALVYRLLLLIIPAFDRDAPHDLSSSGSTKFHWIAAGAALVFGIHPLQVETVAWVAALNGVLYTVFGLAAIIQYLHFARSGSRRRYAFAYGLYLFSLAAKPSAVIIPFMAATLDRFVVGRSWKAIAASTLPWIPPAVVLFWIMRRAQAPARFDIQYPWIDHIPVAIDAWCFYLRKFLLPYPLGMPYGRQPNKVIQQNVVFYLWLVPFFIVALLVKYRPKLLIAAAVLYTLSLAPTLGLVRFGSQDLSTVADRYAYLPLFAASVVAAWMLLRYGRIIRVAFLILAVSWAVLSVKQIQTWHDTRSFDRQGLVVWPHALSPLRRWPGKLFWLPRYPNESNYPAHSGPSADTPS